VFQIPDELFKRT